MCTQVVGAAATKAAAFEGRERGEATITEERGFW